MNSHQDYQAVIWSTVNLPLLQMLWRATCEDGGIPVLLCYESDNPADRQAVMIALGSYTVQKLLDVEPVVVGDDNSTTHRGVHWRLGYIRRCDPQRDLLQQALAVRDTPLTARLRLDGHDWWARVYEEPDLEEIPF
jgi:hypothetical protein